MKTTTVSIFYHRADADGILSGAICFHGIEQHVIKSQIADSPTHTHIHCFGVDYNEPMPENIPVSDILYIVDFCYSPAIIQDLESTHGRVIVIDHHTTTLEAFQTTWQEKNWLINTQWAACILVAQRFGINIPEPIHTLGWRDTGGPWQKGADQTRSNRAHALNAGLMAYAPHDPETLSHLLFPQTPPLTDIWETLYASGKRLSEQLEFMAMQLANSAKMISVPIAWFGPETPAIPSFTGISPELISTFGHHACITHNWTAVAIWTRDPISKAYKVSLRGTGEIHLGNLSRQHYGTAGGGHAQAAGFTTSTVPQVQEDRLNDGATTQVKAHQ